MANTTSLTPNPSTYRQVIENMKKILAMSGNLDLLMASVGDITQLPFSISEMANIVNTLYDLILNANLNGSDIAVTETLIKIIGMHITTTNADINTAPSEYKHGLTVELKNVGVMGLSGKSGMTSPYCFVITLVKDSSIEGEPESIDYVPMQIALATSTLDTYTRFGDLTTDTWGDWIVVEEEEQHQQIVDSATEPIGQVEGDYWLQLIDVDSGEPGPDDDEPDPDEFMFETIGEPTETYGEDLDTIDADELYTYTIM